jgi:hypothetical protein
MNELTIMNMTSEALRRLGRYCIISHTKKPNIAPWFNFFCKLQPKRMRDMARGKTYSSFTSLLTSTFLHPKGYTIEVHKTFEKLFLKECGDVCAENNDPESADRYYYHSESMAITVKN